MTEDAHEAALLRRFRAGDATAFDDLYLRYRARLLRASRAAGADAEDVVQETFVRLWQALHRLPEDLRVYSYAYVVARRLAVERATARALVEQVDELPDVRAAEASTLDDGLLAALADLPRAQRDAIGYRVLDSLPRAAAARLLDVAPRQVDALVARGLLALRARVTPPGP